MCVDIFTNKSLWSFAPETGGIYFEADIPVVVHDTLYAIGSGTNGSFRKVYALNTSTASNDILVDIGWDGNYTAFDESNGAQLWTRAMHNWNNSPVHYNNLIIGWSDRQLYGLNISTGAVAWQLQDNNYYSLAEPSISHDTIFTSVTINNQFQVLAVRAGTGDILWAKKTTESYPYSLCAAGGRIYMGATDARTVNAYSTVDGSFLQNMNVYTVRGYGFVINGVSYYSAQSGMVQ